jgi:hypothetical protein
MIKKYIKNLVCEAFRVVQIQNLAQLDDPFMPDEVMAHV